MAKQMVEQRISLGEFEAQTPKGKPCPYCGKPLLSDAAGQCFKCGMDWHDPNNVIQRGDPNWNRFGLDREKTYVVELCQKPSGQRYTRYREVEAGSHDPHCVLETEPARGAQFIEWGFYKYAKHLKLADGRWFGFEAHGIWMTQDEAAYELRRARTGVPDDDSPPWVNGIPPLFPPA
jgi:hypothetical protein